MSDRENRPSRALQMALSFAVAALIIVLVGVAVTRQLPLDRLPEEQRDEQGEVREEEAERLEEQRGEDAERREERREESEDNSGSG